MNPVFQKLLATSMFAAGVAQAQSDLIITNGKIATMMKEGSSCRPSR
jgi:hypothetical protein